MNKKIKHLPEYFCYVTLKDGKIMVSKMVPDQYHGYGPEKNGYKIAWEPNKNTSPQFLAAVNKITGKNNG